MYDGTAPHYDPKSRIYSLSIICAGCALAGYYAIAACRYAESRAMARAKNRVASPAASNATVSQATPAGQRQPMMVQPNFNTSFDDAIMSAATKYNLRPELIRAVIAHESGGNPSAEGDGGMAIGLMQLHEGACIDVGRDPSLRYDPAHNIDMGCAYLRKCMNLFPVNSAQETLGLMAYNQGPTVINAAAKYARVTLGLIPTG
jgi:soluble lytic murein transglycosylase-like protein